MTTAAQPHELAALFENPGQFDELRRVPDKNQAGITLVWGHKRDKGGFGLSEILADSGFWTESTFSAWLDDQGYSPTEILEAAEVVQKSELDPSSLAEALRDLGHSEGSYEESDLVQWVKYAKDEGGYSFSEMVAWLDGQGHSAEEIQAAVRKATPAEVEVGRWVQYAVPKPPGPTQLATGKVVRMKRTGTLQAGNEKPVEGFADNPVVELLVYARAQDGTLTETDRKVVRPASKLRSINEPENVRKAITLNEQVQSALRRKVEEHNEDVGEAKTKRATYRMLAASMRRGIGAYKQNPGSVRPNVQSPEQWGYGRVNGLLFALKNGRYKRTPFDRDLLPEGHPLSSSTSKADDDLFDTPLAAEIKAEMIGCVGYHVHEVDGSVRYMPCDSMSDYEALTGFAHTSSDDLSLEPIDKAEWSTAYINDLPDSAFFYIGDGGEEDDEGKTKPRSLRKLPYRDASGSVDLPHLRNVLARLSQTDIPRSEQDSIREKARALLESETAEKAVAKDFEDLDFSPPKDVQEAAELGLALRREHGRGGTMIGVARARDLKAGKFVSPETIKRMVSFFARHEVDLEAPSNRDRKDPGYPGAGRIAWLLWGGDAGRRWANKVARQMDRELAQKSESFGSLSTAAPFVVAVADTSTTAWRICKEAAETPVDIIAYSGVRFICGKLQAAEDIPEAYKAVAKSLVEELPPLSVIEVSILKGEAFASDALCANGVDLRGLSRSTRRSVLSELVKNESKILTAAEAVTSGEDLILTARSLVEDMAPERLRIIRSDSSYYEPALELDVVKQQRELWRYVSPLRSSSPKAVFITGSPNRLEGIIGRPLAGQDGQIFKTAYLDRLGLSIDDVSVAHAMASGEDKASWKPWLDSFLAEHAGVPIIALGKTASDAIGERFHTVLPHPGAVRRKGDRGEIERKAKTIRKGLEAVEQLRSRVIDCPIIKADDDKRLVYGVVLEPHTRDLQGDVLTVDTIESAAHRYIVASRLVGDSHSRKAEAEVVESYLAPADYTVGGQSITKGTWIMAVHVKDDDLWSAVKAGEFTGFSIGGTGERKEVTADFPSR